MLTKYGWLKNGTCVPPMISCAAEVAGHPTMAIKASILASRHVFSRSRVLRAFLVFTNVLLPSAQPLRTGCVRKNMSPDRRQTTSATRTCISASPDAIDQRAAGGEPFEIVEEVAHLMPALVRLASRQVRRDVAVRRAPQ